MSGAVYLDTCILIDLIEGTPELQARLAAALRGRDLVSSELVRMEARVGAIRNGRAAHLATYERFFAACRMQPFDQSVFDRATDLRVTHRLKTPDALHLAAALSAGCAEFLTNDRQLLLAAAGNAIRILTIADLGA